MGRPRGSLSKQVFAVFRPRLETGIRRKPHWVCDLNYIFGILSNGREGRCGSMDAKYRRYCTAIAVAVTALGIVTPVEAGADAGVAVFPGMEIHQGATVCTLGFVELSMGIAITTGQCDGGSIVTDNHGKALGSVVTARRNATDAAATDGAAADIEYEVIKLADDVNATDALPGGRRLESSPGAHAQPADQLCHFGISTGQSCGRVSSVNDGRFLFTDMAADPRDVGGPVYVITDDRRAVIVGLLESVSGSASTAESWQAVMQQLYLDARPPGQGQPPGTVRTAGRLAHAN